jgi:ADP-ribose pyrophosphatase
MSDDLAWRLGARHPGHDYRVFRTSFVDAIHPRTGEPKQFSLIECVDWVNVIALTPDDRVVLIRQYRAGLDAVCLEIPGGMVDPGEDAATAAARELEEETGYTAPRWRPLGVVAPNPAIQNNRLHSFLALDAVPTTAPRPDGGEVLSLELAPLATVRAMLRDGRIDHALVLAAFAHLAFELGELHRP